MKAPREQDTVRAILQFLALHKIPAWRMNQGAQVGEYKGKRRFFRYGVTGMSDIIGIRWTTDGVHTYGPMIGQFLAIEVKSRDGTVSPAQQAFLDQVRTAGGHAFVARSVADVQRELGL